MNTITRPAPAPKRLVASFITMLMAVAGLIALPAAPASADTTPALTWKISQQFVDHLSSRTLSGDVTFAAATGFTFSGGVGTTNTTTGATSVDYTGSVKGAFNHPVLGVPCYSVTVADPTVTISAAGAGTISALVSGAQHSACGVANATTEPTRVTVTTFNANAADWTVDGTLRSLTDTPDWAGVLPANSAEATALGIAADKPIDGKSFAPTFLTQVTAGVRAHFYASGSGSDAKKNPAEFTATATPFVAPSVEVSTTSTNPTTGLTLAVTGTAFTRTTNPGDAGVYVGIAESGGITDYTSGGMSNFAAADWVMPAQINETTGAFSKTLVAPAANLDPAKDYSVYTWRAHTHSTTSQDTETPVTIDFEALEKYASTTTVTGLETSTSYGTARTATVTITGGPDGAAKATGTVTASSNGSDIGSGVLNSSGVASISLPVSLPGESEIVFSYPGDVTYEASSSTEELTVTKATTTTAFTGTTGSLVYGQNRKANVTVTGPAGTPVPTGTVTATAGGTTLGSAAVNGSGVASISIPGTTSVGIRTVTYTYSGDGAYNSSSANASLTISKSGVKITHTMTKKPTTKTSGKITISVKSAAGTQWADGKVKVFFKKSGKTTQTTSTSTLKNGKSSSLTVPKLTKKGTWKIYVTYLGTSKYSSASLRYIGTVNVTK